ncbi:cobalt-precorrin 5A hydrolase [Desulfofustis glycolicus]|uniref:Cobalt-precorrin 5A acetaldehyde-lyase n=1 Tax=Desulfofustis glycolicus DSM 9705 TaxID=1121409 RepID=A0A1M5WW50_9BACT|nr:cobalamin biosynthesis protein [Desulfofustis glycolicus]MCB2214498.1 cobalamin biosynthesis protein [Desulfobulbaceae bacterium]SHH91925.1 cobalt-precorrin 5A acetaldehyde-lyase [Desulfofustis glycolicus DSM 9705]
MMRIALLAVTDRGRRLAETISREMGDGDLLTTEDGVRKAIEAAWRYYDGLICIMATGIVVRCIAGLCRDKISDPCVVVVDEQGQFAISLLSGHIGGGNDLARQVANACGGQAVITTASDVSGHTAVDLWAVEQQCRIVNPEQLAAVTARLLNRGFIRVFQDERYVDRLPDDFRDCVASEDADLIISRQPSVCGSSLQLLPCRRFIGFGCRKGVAEEDFARAVTDLQQRFGLDPRSVAGVASIDIKAQEAGLLQIARRYRWPIRFFSAEQLNRIVSPSVSAKVYEKTGAHSVCEAAAMLAAGSIEKPGTLIINKVKWKTITAAVAQRVD